MTDVATNLERIRNTQGQIEQAKAAQVLASNRFNNGVGTNLKLPMPVPMYNVQN